MTANVVLVRCPCGASKKVHKRKIVERKTFPCYKCRGIMVPVEMPKPEIRETKPEIDHSLTQTTKYLRMLFGKSPTGRTVIVYILAERTNVELGRIKWYGAWRQYAFYPSTDKVTIFNEECMGDITKVIQELMAERA